MGKITFGKTPSQADKMKTATARGYDTGKPSKGKTPAPSAKITGRPTGGLKPSGVKIKITKKF